MRMENLCDQSKRPFWGDALNNNSNKKNAPLLHAVLLASVSTLAIGMSATSGYAQSVNVADSSTESVVVSGTRAALKTAQSIKQESDQLVDSLSAVAIG